MSVVIDGHIGGSSLAMSNRCVIRFVLSPKTYASFGYFNAFTNISMLHCLITLHPLSLRSLPQLAVILHAFTHDYGTTFLL